MRLLHGQPLRREVVMRIDDLDDDAIPVWEIALDRIVGILIVLAAISMILWPAFVRAEYEIEIVRKFTVEIVSKPAAVQPAKQTTGLHSHRCPYDGTEWWHGEDQLGKSASHACPKCGRVQWTVAQQAPKAVVIAPKVMQSSNCPNGICPLPTRRGRR